MCVTRMKRVQSGTSEAVNSPFEFAEFLACIKIFKFAPVVLEWTNSLTHLPF